MRLALIIIGSAIGVFAVLAGGLYGASQAFDESKTDTHAFSHRVKHVIVEADAGDIEVSQGRRTVEVREIRHYVFDSPELSRSVERGVLTLRSECGSVPIASCQTDYRIEIPEGVTVDARTHVGDIDAVGIDARRIEARSNVGDVSIESTRRPDIRARTNVGDVEVTTPGRADDVEADTDVGGVDVWRRG